MLAPSPFPLLWIPLRGLYFPTFAFLTQDYLKLKVRKILDTTYYDNSENQLVYFFISHISQTKNHE
jgi:hypothetical protein